ncbi:EexN family lipoprotein [Methylotenera sp.]|uniref:EexN family lipoprotein n=1 Tax=Methylotenera sp. TaxID=2051956 RepID=UPI00248A3317|nr:EexN family lipoprotein [Methylotenera sp.]MDI1298623.1 EexN family lipoprotein [Methylotenera sp.]
MKKHYLTLAILLTLTACGQHEKTITVPEFVKDPELTKKTIKWCNENPGERQALPNCVNSSQAQIKIWHCKEFKKTVCE